MWLVQEFGVVHDGRSHRLVVAIRSTSKPSQHAIEEQEVLRWDW